MLTLARCGPRSGSTGKEMKAPTGRQVTAHSGEHAALRNPVPVDISHDDLYISTSHVMGFMENSPLPLKAAKKKKKGGM